MTDISRVLSEAFRSVKRKFVDNGDGTYSEAFTLSTGLNETDDSVALGARAGLGATPFNNIDVDETEDAVSTGPCTLYLLIATNKNAATLFLKLYNDTVANVAVGTTVPTMTIAIPTGAGVVINTAVGVKFDTALTIAATTGVATADTGAPGANDLVVSGAYKA